MRTLSSARGLRGHSSALLLASGLALAPGSALGFEWLPSSRAWTRTSPRTSRAPICWAPSTPPTSTRTASRSPGSTRGSPRSLPSTARGVAPAPSSSWWTPGPRRGRSDPRVAGLPVHLVRPRGPGARHASWGAGTGDLAAPEGGRVRVRRADAEQAAVGPGGARSAWARPRRATSCVCSSPGWTWCAATAATARRRSPREASPGPRAWWARVPRAGAGHPGLPRVRGALGAPDAVAVPRGALRVPVREALRLTVLPGGHPEGLRRGRPDPGG